MGADDDDALLPTRKVGGPDTKDWLYCEYCGAPMMEYLQNYYATIKGTYNVWWRCSEFAGIEHDNYFRGTRRKALMRAPNFSRKIGERFGPAD